MQDKILKVQIQKIKIAQKQLGIDEATYRALLKTFDIYPVSCTQLTQGQADTFLENLKNHGWTPRQSSVTKKNKYKDFNHRMGLEATGGQMRMIEAMWMEVAREKTETAMNKFIAKMTKKSHITFVSKDDIKVLKHAIERFDSAQRKNYTSTKLSNHK